MPQNRIFICGGSFFFYQNNQKKRFFQQQKIEFRLFLQKGRPARMKIRFLSTF